MAFSIGIVVSFIFYISHVKSEINLSVNDLVGNFPPVFSPNYDNGTVNVENISRYAKLLADNGIPGIILTGTNGEAPLVCLEERMLLTDAWMAAAKQYNLQIVLHVGGLPFPDQLKLAKYAGDKGVDGILALPELYFRPINVEELVYNIKLIADQAPDAPVIYYNNPEISKVNLNMVDFFKNATCLIPNFCGLKCPLNIAFQVMANVQLLSYQRLFVMTDFELLAAYNLGANGTISTSCDYFPDLCTALQTAVQAENVAEARAIQLEISRKAAALTFKYSTSETLNGIGRSKAAFEIITGIPMGNLRQPAIPISDETKQEIAQDLADLGVPTAQQNE